MSNFKLGGGLRMRLGSNWASVSKPHNSKSPLLLCVCACAMHGPLADFYTFLHIARLFFYTFSAYFHAF